MARKEKPAYLDATAPVDRRVRDLIGRMTLEEKVGQMGQRRLSSLMKDGRLVAKSVRECFGRMSIGTLEDPHLAPRISAEAVNAVQEYLVSKTRLGIPALIISECLHGHMSDGATIFPQAIALGSTWNPDLVRRMAEAAAKEARSVGVAQALSPDLDLAREPRWGRVEETYGEDPYLVERMGVAYIRGMQGQGPGVDGEHLVCTPKHFAAHGSPEGGINLAPVAAGERELRALYLPPFEAAIRAAGALSIMPCYSELDGVPAHASHFLLTRILREEWGFQGYVYSDYGGVSMLEGFHRTAHTAAEAGKQALEAGLDLEAPRDFGFGEVLVESVRKGEISVDVVDRAVSRILRVKFFAGLFENPFCDAARAEKVCHAPAHRALAREIAQEAIILLENRRNLLPLDPGIGSVAVIGPNADLAQLGDYSRRQPPEAVTPLDGIRAVVSKRTHVRHAQGCPIYGSSREGFAVAVEAAQHSEVAVVVLGGTSVANAGTGWGTDEDFSTCGEGFDRSELTALGVQEDLARAVIGTGTPAVVVLVHGRPYGIEWIAEHARAVVEAWYPGEQGGHALADVLFGRVNPSGRLPVSVPRTVGHVPAFYNHKPSARGYYHKPGSPEDPGRDYVFSSPEPLWPFGHGLSYTRFSYSNLRVTPARIRPSGRVQVSVDVRNAGKRAGKEVVQLYLNDVVSSVTTPVKALRRFDKVALRPGEKRTVTFTLSPDDLKVLDHTMRWVVESGQFEVIVGGRKKTFTVH